MLTRDFRHFGPLIVRPPRRPVRRRSCHPRSASGTTAGIPASLRTAINHIIDYHLFFKNNKRADPLLFMYNVCFLSIKNLKLDLLDNLNLPLENILHHYFLLHRLSTSFSNVLGLEEKF